MTEKQIKLLSAPFPPDEIEWRIANTNKEKTQGFVVPYVDSRAIQKRLDDVLGFECWQNHFRTTPASGKEPGAHICEISIKTEGMTEWLTKSDGAGSTDIESIKGGLSGAFKRAASMWGVGRYLYEMKGAWAEIKPFGKSFHIADSEQPKLANYYQNKVAAIFGKAAAPQKQEQPQREPAEFYKVNNAKTTGNGAQTFVELQKNSGEKICGYIVGDPELRRGQKLVNLKYESKRDEKVGEYNIIKAFDVAA